MGNSDMKARTLRAHIDAGSFVEPLLHRDVRSVAVLSDLHLGAGEENDAAGKCVLDEPGVIDRLVHDFDRYKIHVDVIVLNGDMCDFALATMDRTLRSARQLINRLSPYCLAFAYVPGNHDHHTWLLANELHELLAPFPYEHRMYLPRTERMYKSSYLARLSAHDSDVAHYRDVWVAYPNLYWRPPSAGEQLYIFHHGHYCEELYAIVWTILNAAFPERVMGGLETLEAACFGWLEFIWYSLGQAGKGLGANGIIEHLYDQLNSGHGMAALETPFRNLYDTLIRPVVHRALDRMIFGRLLHEFVDKHLPALALRMLVAYGESRREAGRQPGASALRNAPLDDTLAKHCQAYIERTRQSRCDLPTPQFISFFFGHTHRFGFWPSQPDVLPLIFNDGGWIRHVDGGWPDAHVLFLNEHGGVDDLHFGPDKKSSRYTMLRAPRRIGVEYDPED